MKNYMNEEAVFAQKVSDEELESINGGYCGMNGGDACQQAQYEYNHNHCTDCQIRHIYEGGFANCAATVEDGSWCNLNDACYTYNAIKYQGMTDCHKAWR